jgi:hypothetical protein
VRRFFTTQRHLLGLLTGAFVAEVRRRRDDRGGVGLLPATVLAGLLRPFLMAELRDKPFPSSCAPPRDPRPTYIKLGQVLSLREDILRSP